MAYVLGSVSGHPVLDLYNLMNQKSSQPFSIQEKKMGDSININQQKYHVIWPPQKANNVFSETINKKIKAINEKISENSKVSEIWEQIKKQSVSEKSLGLENDKNDFIGNERLTRDIDSNYKKELITTIRSLANHFSLCLFKPDDLLFLGDLEEEDIHSCISLLLKGIEKEKIEVKYFITPHHGTHWHDILKAIKAEYVISSNGNKMNQHYCLEFDTIGRYCHKTKVNGTFIGE